MIVLYIIVGGILIIILIWLWRVIKTYVLPRPPVITLPPVTPVPVTPPPPPAPPPPPVPLVPVVRFVSGPTTIGQGPGKRGTFVYRAETAIGTGVRGRNTRLQLAAVNGGAMVRLDGWGLKEWSFADGSVLYEMKTDDSGPDAGEIDVVIELNDHIGPATLTATDIESGASVAATFSGVP